MGAVDQRWHEAFLCVYNKPVMFVCGKSNYRHVVQSQKTSFTAFYSIFRVIFTVSAGFMGLLGSVFGLWSLVGVLTPASGVSTLVTAATHHYSNVPTATARYSTTATLLTPVQCSNTTNTPYCWVTVVCRVDGVWWCWGGRLLRCVLLLSLSLLSLLSWSYSFLSL